MHVSPYATRFHQLIVLAMRRTLFVLPRDLLPAALGSASARVAGQEASRIARDAVHGGLTDDGTTWLAECERLVLAELAEGGLSAIQLRKGVPQLGAKIQAGGENTKWGGAIPIGPRVLGWLGTRGLIVRGENAGHWRLSRAAWTKTEERLGEITEPLEEQAGCAELVRRWLHTFGPGTTRDLSWWLGSTVTAARRALGDVGAVEVSLDGGGTGWLLPDDLEAEAARLTEWLDGVVINSIYASRQMKAERLP